MDFDGAKDVIKVPHSTRDFEPVHGARPEPEEMTATHVLETVGTPVAIQGEIPHGDVMRTLFTHEESAPTVGRYAKAQCHLCLYWDHKGWVENMQGLDMDPRIEKRRNLNAVRSIFANGTHTGDVRKMTRSEGEQEDDDIEQATASFGICTAYTGIFCATGLYKGQKIITMPTASCPRDNPLYGGEAPFLFVPKDADAAKLGESIHSKVLRLADGRAPKMYFTGAKDTGTNK